MRVPVADLEALVEVDHVERLELGLGELVIEVDCLVVGRALLLHIEREQRLDVDVCLRRLAELSLGLLDGVLQSSHGARVRADVGQALRHGLRDEELGNVDVEVLPSQSRIAAGCLHLSHASLDSQHAHIERTAAQIEDENLRRLVRMAPVQAVRQSCCRGLVDDTQHLQAGYLTSRLRGRALTVVEVGRHCDDCLRDGPLEERLSGLLKVGQHHRTDLFGRERLLAVHAQVDLDERLARASLAALARL